MDNEYKKFFEDTPVGFFRTDIESGRFLMGNEACAKLLGFDGVAELLEHGNAKTLYPVAQRRKLIKLMLKQGEVNGVEIRLNLGDREIWVAGFMHINCGGTCIEGTLIDISEQKRLESQLAVKKDKLCALTEKLDAVLASYEK